MATVHDLFGDRITTPFVPSVSPSIPPLENGDHLSRDEFERRYDAMPWLKKAELIEGVVYMPSPVRLENHSAPHLDASTWLGVYRAYTPGVRAGADGTIRLDLDNEPQPDAILLVDPACGGQALIDADDYVAGAPEFVLEVAASSASIDLHAKFRVFQRNKVREYVVWRIHDATVDWFVLENDTFAPLAPDAEGIFRSLSFPGLWLSSKALIRNDMAEVLRVLQLGLESPQHAQFVARLQSARQQFAKEQPK
jgi:Uma2 family endonuclease